MARIASVTLPKEKRIVIALRSIYGIGPTRSKNILKEAHINENTRTKDLTAEEVNVLRETIEKQYRVEGDLRREVLANIKRLRDIGSYRGSRHAKSLPVRGQRTKTNSRTVHGNVRRTAGSGKKGSAQKT